MNYVNLGTTDMIISEVGFGCIPIIRLSKDAAVQVLRHAFERGITYFDTANAYRDSEEKLGLAFAGRRDQVVLATKTLMRGAEGATSHLDNSLRMISIRSSSPSTLIEEAAKDELMTATRDQGMGFIVMKPFGGGVIDNNELAGLHYPLL